MMDRERERKAWRRALLRRVSRARNFPDNTCPASRHLHIMADCLLKKPPAGDEAALRYPMLAEEPEHCAESILAVLAELWEARTALAKLKEHRPTRRRGGTACTGKG